MKKYKLFEDYFLAFKVLMNISVPPFFLIYFYNFLGIEFDGIFTYIVYFVSAFSLMFVFLNIDRTSILEDTPESSFNGAFYSYFSFSWFFIILSHLFVVFLFWLFGFTFAEFFSYSQKIKLLLVSIWVILMYPLSLIGREIAIDKNNDILVRLLSAEK